MKRSGTTVQIELDTPARVRLVLRALLTGLVLFAGVVVFLIRDGGLGDPALTPLLRAVLAATGVTLWAAAGVVTRALAAGRGGSAEAKRAFGLIVVRAACADGFGLVGSVFALLTGDPWFLAAPAAAAVILLRLMPRDGSGGPAGPGEGASSRSHPIEP